MMICFFFKVEVEDVVAEGLGHLAVEVGEVGVFEGLMDGDSFGGIEDEHLREEVEGELGGGGGEVGGEGVDLSAPLVGAGDDGLFGGVVDGDAIEGVVRGPAEDGDDGRELVLGGVAAEEGLSPQHLREDAADGPDVDGLVVARRFAEKFGRAVPPRDDVLRQLARGVVVDAPGQAEVADRQVAVRVHQQVARLEVPVQHRRRVDVLETAEDLVQKVLVMRVRQGLPRRDDAVEVALHEVRHDVHVREVDRVRRHRDDVLDLDDVLVRPEVTQQLDLAQNPLRVHEVREHVRDLLDRHPLPRHPVVRRAHHTVGPPADRTQVRVPDVDVERVTTQGHRVVLTPERRHIATW
mmetsp:Transcript_38820/g.124449  ORF Transcript_38820/g.124449 Transcript_38820/m.124449 type:complete len:351 (+) Transcript_38820:695-1747(+)